jgi:hypothetical protein
MAQRLLHPESRYPIDSLRKHLLQFRALLQDTRWSKELGLEFVKVFYHYDYGYEAVTEGYIVRTPFSLLALYLYSIELEYEKVTKYISITTG